MPSSLEEPIFILGNPRSGTTLLRLMITCHPRIVVPPECGFAAWLHKDFGSWNADSATDMVPRFAEAVLSSRKIETWGLGAPADGGLRGFLETHRPVSYPEAAARVYQYYAEIQGQAFLRWGDKNNFYIDYIETLHAMYPRAFYVHLVRDGRNVACSYKDLHRRQIDSVYAPKLPFEIEEIARQWSGNNRKIGGELERLAPGRSYCLRFEDLVVEPESQLRVLCEALGEAYDPAMLEYHLRNRERQLEPSEMMAWKRKTLRPPMASEVARYRDELSAAERAAFERVAGEILQRHGYLS